uniref:Uncharacterized protein n=1 Tax=Kwoniella pini CBS 10737 TaxID=1296096 RepID=A0A1B9I9S4_9TREE|nr:uncharacterized protein I206_01624 [Kwoniella pini CBS 10737]OCF52335.1 hypothetical protein I206_01624 [Kwoniella pini CBS 10737]
MKPSIVDKKIVLDGLRSLPEDTSILDPPNVTQEQASYFTRELLAFVEERQSQAARHTVLQAASNLSPEPVWENTALQWSQNADRTGAGNDRIITYIIKGFKEGVFQPELWLQGLENETKDNEVSKEILVAWGKDNFDTLLERCTGLYTRSSMRMPIATLLIKSVVEYPYHPSDVSSATYMARVANSTFVDILLQSLILDTGNQLFSINLRLLLAILPYAPLILTSKVPLMAIVLGRAISWRDRPFIDHTPIARDGVTQTQIPDPSLNWDVATSATEIEIDMPDHLKPRRIAQMFIIAMYGAWPSNVIAFVRDPVSYIRGKNVQPIYAVDWDRVWSPGVLATRLEPLIRDFRLHPSLVVFTSTAELADAKRWEKIDASEFIARSQALSNSDQQAISHAGLFDEEEQLVNVVQSMDSGNLGKENELLRLEAKYTARVRKQYLYHIGRLHRTSLRLNNDEAEIHSFVNRLKAQTSQIAELTTQLSQARTDASLAQQKHVKWQTQLRDKIANFREEKATWQTEAARIRAELSEARATAAAQHEELAEVKNERFKLQNRLTEADPKIRHIADYEIRMKQLTDSQRLWDEDVQRCKEALQQAEASKARCHEMLRASRQETTDQAQAISSRERKVPTLQRRDREDLPDDRNHIAKSSQDIEVYIKLLEEAKARSDKLERENLELRNNIPNPPKKEGDAHDRSFIFEDQVV